MVLIFELSVLEGGGSGGDLPLPEPVSPPSGSGLDGGLDTVMVLTPPCQALPPPPPPGVSSMFTRCKSY